MAIRTCTAVCAVGYLVDADDVADICIVSHNAQRCAVADPDAVRRLDDQRSAGDRRVVAGRGIILPNIRGVPVLPFAQYDVLHVGRQRDLCGRYCAVRIVFEYLRAADPCGFRVFTRLDQGEGNVRRGIGGQPVVGIQIGDVGDIGQQAAAHAGQLVGADRQHVAAYGFARSQRCLGSRALSALPCYCDRTVCQRNRCLVSVNHGRDDEFARRARPVRRVVSRVYVVDLCAGLICAQISGLRFAVRKINDRLRAGCDDRHDDTSSSSLKADVLCHLSANPLPIFCYFSADAYGI